jgi:polyribonucleotide nucleotidyltransferase
MNEAISTPRATVNQSAPKVATVQIPPEKIGELIGPGGKMIKQIQAEFVVDVNVEESGFVVVTGQDLEKVTAAKEYIAGLTAEAEVGKIYEGTVMRVESYGAFVEVLPGQDGLVHVSRMSTEFVDDANSVVKVGQKVQVKCYEVDGQGRINLTMLLNDEKPTGRPESRGGDRGNNSNGGGFQKFRDRR